MNAETKLRALGFEVPSLEDLYRTNASGAHYISHFPVQNLLYLSGTTPRKDGHAYLPGDLRILHDQAVGIHGDVGREIAGGVFVTIHAARRAPRQAAVPLATHADAQRRDVHVHHRDLGRPAGRQRQAADR